MERIVGKTKHGEIDIDSLAAMQPCMSRVMRQYTERYGIMYHACKARNWELGLYQLKEIQEISEVGKKTRPVGAGAGRLRQKIFSAHRKCDEKQGLGSV